MLFYQFAFSSAEAFSFSASTPFAPKGLASRVSITCPFTSRQFKECLPWSQVSERYLQCSQHVCHFIRCLQNARTDEFS